MKDPTGLVIFFLLGISIGYLFGWVLRGMTQYRNYAQGRRDMADEIERASGMRDPVCTCATDPTRCVYHQTIEQDHDEAEEENRK